MLMKNIDIICTQNEQKIHKYCLLGLKYRLYRPEGLLKDYFATKNHNRIKYLVIILHLQKPIGIGVYLKNIYHYNLMVYVKKPYRHKGIGTRLIQKLKLKSKQKKFNVWRDSPSINKFWDHVKV